MENGKRHREIEEEIRDIAPGLSGQPYRKHAGDIPFRYFEKLSDQVIQRLAASSSAEKSGQTGWIQWITQQWYSRRVLIVSMASVLSVILATGLWLFTAKPLPVMDFSQINPAEARSYLISCAGELDDVQLSMLNDQDLGEEFMPVTDEELKGVIDEYLYQIPSENQFN
ncbi:MAG: hypothetical protein SH818_00255 [Saprospiraceae bacterium]|nr:hypothetical protein [Saprospiraceae bacterium]